MLNIEKFELENGLKVLLNQDVTTPLVAFNLLYDVGSRDENPNQTGYAHLLEHLMFEGSKHIPRFDQVLQQAGGESNAFTSTDVTNYYITLPKQNIETAFWLESDRMFNLAITQEKLDIQKKVVIEEFKQSYLNQPYGNVWHLLRSMVYKKHPYRWPTIGIKIKHIQDAKLEDVNNFFKSYYNSANAILCLSGNISLEETKQLAQKWFGQYSTEEKRKRNLPKEAKQKLCRRKTVTADVPYDAIYIAFNMCDRLHKDYYATDLLSDLLSNGKSSRFFNKFIRTSKIFVDINAYIMGSHDNGMCIISGYLKEGVDVQIAENEIFDELFKLSHIKEKELDKVKNKIEFSFQTNLMQILDRAYSLASYELLGDASNIRFELDNYAKVSINDIQRVASKILSKENASILYYLKTTSDNQNKNQTV